jgi:hypothetical protein
MHAREKERDEAESLTDKKRSFTLNIRSASDPQVSVRLIFTTQTG